MFSIKNNDCSISNATDPLFLKDTPVLNAPVLKLDVTRLKALFIFCKKYLGLIVAQEGVVLSKGVWVQAQICHLLALQY